MLYQLDPENIHISSHENQTFLTPFLPKNEFVIPKESERNKKKTFHQAILPFWI
jgi:hypothetical protein